MALCGWHYYGLASLLGACASRSSLTEHITASSTTIVEVEITALLPWLAANLQQ